MKNVNYLYDDTCISSIRQRLQTIRNILFDDTGILKKQLRDDDLQEAMDYLERENGQLPNYFGRQIDSVLSEVRYTLSKSNAGGLN
jgi:hypothetical protein